MVVIARFAYSRVIRLCAKTPEWIITKHSMEETDVPALLGGFRDGNLGQSVIAAQEGDQASSQLRF